jgi:hypothetical protein
LLQEALLAQRVNTVVEAVDVVEANKEVTMIRTEIMDPGGSLQ